MPKKKKKKEKQLLTITRSTFTTWMKSQAKGTKENWEDRMCPYCTGDFLQVYSDYFDEIFEEKGGFNPNDFSGILIKTLDEEYFSWLEETGKENSEASRLEYPMSYEKAEELLKKNHFDRDYHLMLLPFTFMADDMFSQLTNFSLNQEEKNKLVKLLEEAFGEGNVCVVPYFLKPETVLNEYERLMDMACSFFENSTSIRYGRYQEQKNRRGVNYLEMAIPVIIRGTRNKCYYSMDELYDITPNDNPYLVTLFDEPEDAYCEDDNDDFSDEEYFEDNVNEEDIQTMMENLSMSELDRLIVSCDDVDDEDFDDDFEIKDGKERIEKMVNEIAEKEQAKAFLSSPFLLRFDEYLNYIEEERNVLENQLNRAGLCLIKR